MMVEKNSSLENFEVFQNFSLSISGWRWDFKNKIKELLVGDSAFLDDAYELVFKGLPGMWLMHFYLCFKLETEKM